MTIRLTQDGSINMIQSGDTTASNTVADIRITNMGSGSTSGTTYMTISTSGNIGIGTTSPSQRLDIVGGSLRITGGSLLATHNSNTIGSLFTTGGNVGIGTSSPNTKLHVMGTGSLDDTIQSIGTTNGNIVMTATVPHNTPSIKGYGLVTGVLGTGLTWMQSKYLDQIGTTLPMSLQPLGGNLGIGTSSPTTTLDIIRPGTTGNYIRLQARNQTYSGISFTEGGWWGHTIRLNQDTDSLHFSVQDNTPTFSDVMTITYGGNLGIGTTSPSAKLDIFGGSGSNGANGSPLIALQYYGGGFRHFIKSRHTTLSDNSGNGIDFYINNTNTEGGSSAPGTGNKLGMSITGAGIGIGTSSPDYILTIGSSAVNNPLGINVQNSSGSGQIGIAASAGQFSNSSAAGDTVIRSLNKKLLLQSGWAVNSAMCIDTSNNIGIGTSSPACKLHVVGSASTNTIPSTGTGDSAVFSFMQPYDGSSGYGLIGGVLATSGLVWLQSKYYSSSSALPMALQPLGGNVGIGTSSPTNKLHISPGSIRLSRVNNTAQVWDIQADSDANLWFYFEGAPKGYLAWSADVGQIDFTGQHRSKSETISDITNKVGYIVRSTGQFDNMSGNSSPTINESIPVVSLTNINNDKAVFGVISDKESDSTIREYSIGSFVSATEKEVSDQRLIINSVGEGAIWVCNANGNIDNGDYITSCQVPGLGMRQADDILHNYTVAKATCNVDFSDIQELKNKYQTRFLQEDGTIITEQEYTSKLSNNEAVFIGAFIGCTYHCG